MLFYMVSTFSFLSASSYSKYDFPLDDAWVHRIYARSFSSGNGFEYNEGAQEAGSTSPLWSIVSSPAHWLEGFGAGTVVFAVKMIGMLLGMLVLLICYKLTYLMTQSKISAMVAGVIFAVEPRFLYATYSGMENTLLILLWAGACYALIRQKWIVSLCLFGLTPTARPEALVLLPLCAVTFWFMNRSDAYWKKITSLFILCCPFFMWMIFCLFTNGHWLPNTFYMKAQSPQLSAKEFVLCWLLLSQHGFSSLVVFILGLAVFGLFLIFKKTNNALTFLIFLVAAPIAYLLGVVATRQMNLTGYYWTRWPEPAILMLTIPFGMGIGILAHQVLQKQNWKSTTKPQPWFHHRVFLSILSGLGLLMFLISIPALAKSFSERRTRLATDSRAIHLMDVKTGIWISRNTPQDAKVGVNNTGAIRYFGNRRTFDFFGLNNSEITFHKKSFMELVDDVDWLAIYPAIFKDAEIFHLFEARMSHRIPLSEYTVCKCPSQIHVVVYEKRKPQPLQ